MLSSIQFGRPVVYDSLQPNRLQHSRPPYPSPTLGVYSNEYPLSRWCHPTILSSVVPFSSCFNLSQHQGLLKWVSSSHQVAKVLELQLQHQSNEHSGLIFSGMDWLDLLAVQETLKSLLQHLLGISNWTSQDLEICCYLCGSGCVSLKHIWLYQPTALKSFTAPHYSYYNSHIFKMSSPGNSLVVWWLGLHTFTAESLGSVPGWGTKISQATTRSSFLIWLFWLLQPHKTSYLSLTTLQLNFYFPSQILLTKKFFNG